MSPTKDIGLTEEQVMTVVDSARHHGISEVRVFGSVMRGTADADSDLDLLVRLDSGRDLFDLISFKQNLQEKLGLRVDVLTEAALSPYIRKSVVRDAVHISRISETA